MFVSVSIYQKDEECKAKNRKLPCLFCHQIVFQMPRHLRRVHRNIPEVASANNQSLRKMIGVGVFQHNVAVLKDGHGQFIVARSSPVKRIVEDYVPCKFCLHFFVKGELYRHCHTCACKYEENHHSPVSDGILLLDGAIDAKIPQKLKAQVIARMRRDSVTETVKNDDLILMLGSSLLKKLGPRRANAIAQKMRALARLRRCLEVMHRDNNETYTLHRAISGDKFDDVLQAVEKECQAYDDETGRRLYRNPSLALSLVNVLKKCAHLKRGMAIRLQDTVAVKQVEDFLHLYVTEIPDSVTSPALGSQRAKKCNLEDFPEEEDLTTLKAYLLAQMSQLSDQLAGQPTAADWRRLAELTLTRVIVFNGRRGSEAAQLLVSEYELRTNNVQSDVLNSMSTVEKQLVNRYIHVFLIT